MASLLAVVVLAFVLLHIIGVAIQTWNIANGTWEPAVDWAQHGGLKMAIVGGRALSMVALLVLFAIFVGNIFRSTSGPFVKANSALLFWSLVPYVIYAFCESNFGIINGIRYIQVDTQTILGGGFLLLIAFIYGRATLLAEENDLTI